MRSVRSMTPRPRDERATAVVRVFQTASFIAALAASLALLLFPFLLHHVQETRLHSALPIMLLGVAGALVYGIGYRSDNKLLQILFGPICAWTLIIAGIWMLLAP
jgi:predicted membrane protein